MLYFLQIVITLGVFSCWAICALPKIDAQKVIGYFIAAFAISLILVMSTMLFGQNFHEMFFFADAFYYNLSGLEIASAIDANSSSAFYSHSRGTPNPGYYNLTGFLYHYLDFDSMNMRIMNCGIGAAVVLPLYLIAKYSEFPNVLPDRICLIYICLPQIALIFGTHTKDAIVSLLTLGAILLSLQLPHTKNLKTVALLTISIFIMWQFRRNLALGLAMLCLLPLLFHFTLTKYKLQPFSAFLGAAVFFVLLNFSIFIATPETFEFLFWSLEVVHSMQILGDMEAGYSQSIRIESLADIFKLPIAAAFVLVAPLAGTVNVTSGLDILPMHFSYLNTASFIFLPLVFIGFLKFRSAFSVTGSELLLRWVPLCILAIVAIVYLGTFRYSALLWTFFSIFSGIGSLYFFKYRYLLASYAILCTTSIPSMYFFFYHS